MFCFVLVFVSLFVFVLFCFLSPFLFLFVCVDFFGGGGFGLVWSSFVCLFVCLFVWLVGWLFVCLFVWLFGCLVVWLCWFVFAVKQKEPCAQYHQNRSQLYSTSLFMPLILGLKLKQ